jgi:hypothetical protein
MKDEALKLALEALEAHADIGIKSDKAITAIKQALANEALDKKAENARELGLDYEPDYKVTVVDDQHPKGVPLEQWGRPAPVQEPVAWMVDVDLANYQGQSEYRTILAWNSKPVWSGTHEINEVLKAVPLYTTPPAAQRQWVRLSEEEIGEIFNNQPGYCLDHYIFAEDVMSKYEEKNAVAKLAVPDVLNPKDENPAYAAGWNDCRAEMLKGMK